MGGSTIQVILLVLASGALGIIAGLLLGALVNKRRVARLHAAAQAQLGEAARERGELAADLADFRSQTESLQDAVERGRREIENTRDKTKLLSRKVLALRAEREDTKIKVGTLQKSLLAVREQTLALQREFEKAGNFYKGELRKSLQKRQAVEKELQSVREEQDAFTRRVEASVLEHGSPDEMLAAAQLRLGQLSVLERSVNKLERENEELRGKLNGAKREYEALERSLAELDELRINNKQLVRCVEALEDSRARYENDADRYRDQAEQSEQLSDTLRLKLDDLEKNFADMEVEQQQALSKARHSKVDLAASAANASHPDDPEREGVVDLSKYSNRA